MNLCERISGKPRSAYSIGTRRIKSTPVIDAYLGKGLTALLEVKSAYQLWCYKGTRGMFSVEEGNRYPDRCQRAGKTTTLNSIVVYA